MQASCAIVCHLLLGKVLMTSSTENCWTTLLSMFQLSNYVPLQAQLVSHAQSLGVEDNGTKDVLVERLHTLITTGTSPQVATVGRQVLPQPCNKLACIVIPYTCPTYTFCVEGETQNPWSHQAFKFALGSPQAQRTNTTFGPDLQIWCLRNRDTTLCVCVCVRVCMCVCV